MAKEFDEAKFLEKLKKDFEGKNPMKEWSTNRVALLEEYNVTKAVLYRNLSLIHRNNTFHSRKELTKKQAATAMGVSSKQAKKDEAVSEASGAEARLNDALTTSVKAEDAAKDAWTEVMEAVDNALEHGVKVPKQLLPEPDRKLESESELKNQAGDSIFYADDGTTKLIEIHRDTKNVKPGKTEGKAANLNTLSFGDLKARAKPFGITGVSKKVLIERIKKAELKN